MSRALQSRYLTRATLTFLLACAVVAALIAGSGGPATAATFTVTKTADTADGTCDSDCSLREAVIAANAAPGLDTISLPSGTFSLTIVGGGEDSAATGDLDVTDNLEIDGAGVTNTAIEVAAGNDRVFDVIIVSPVTFTLLTVRDAEIRNGKGDVGFGCECGGGILVRTDAWLTLINARVANNSATGGSLSTGGGIDNGGTLTLENTVVSGNTADFAGGINNGPAASFTMTGGYIQENTSSASVGGVELPPGSAATLIGVWVVGNKAAGGAGGLDVSGTLTMTDTNVHLNSAGGNGGGIEVSGGQVSVVSSSIFVNSASGDGGGIFSNGNVTLTNSTISNNSAGGSGAGILNNVVAVLTSTNSTIGGSNVTSGLHNFGTAQLKNTIVGINKGVDCVVVAPISSLGHNLDSDGTCGLSGPGDLPNRDPGLGPLESTALTFWHPLPPGSPAVDAGDDSGCPATDQRGVQRPLDGNGDGTPVCDIGAYELLLQASPTPSAAPSVTPVQPASVPQTGGRPGQDGMPLVAVLATLPALVGAAALSWRLLRRSR